MDAAPVTDEPFFVCDIKEVPVREAALCNIRVEWPSIKVLSDFEYCTHGDQFVKLERTASKWMIDTGP